MNRRLLWSLNLAVGLVALLLAGLRLPARPTPQTVLAAPSAKIARQVWEATAGGGEAEFLVVLVEQADLRARLQFPVHHVTGQNLLNYVLRHNCLPTQTSVRRPHGTQQDPLRTIPHGRMRSCLLRTDPTASKANLWAVLYTQSAKCKVLSGE